MIYYQLILQSIIIYIFSTPSYSMKSFLEYCEDSPILCKRINDFKGYLIDITFTYDLYKLISRKKYYYYATGSSKPPKESCYYTIKKMIFSDISPYHFDFGFPNPSPKNIKRMLLKLKKKFGYSDRRKTQSSTFYKFTQSTVSTFSLPTNRSVLSYRQRCLSSDNNTNTNATNNNNSNSGVNQHRIKLSNIYQNRKKVMPANILLMPTLTY